MLCTVSRSDMACANAASVNRGPAGLNILAVDDDPAITHLAELALRKNHHQVETASSGEQALTRLADQAFDLVLTDLRLGPGMNGWQLAAEVRQRWPSVRVVLVTAWGPAIDAPAAPHSGVDAVLAKPFAVAGLRDLVARMAADIDSQRDGAGGT
jgi:CheY-like chemotaxis protein